jgi:hypothetical protein
VGAIPSLPPGASMACSGTPLPFYFNYNSDCSSNGFNVVLYSVSTTALKCIGVLFANLKVFIVF